MKLMKQVQHMMKNFMEFTELVYITCTEGKISKLNNEYFVCVSPIFSCPVANSVSQLDKVGNKIILCYYR